MGAKDQKTEALGRDVEPGGDTLVELSQYEPYVKPGFLGMFESKYVVVCSFVVRLGGFLFG